MWEQIRANRWRSVVLTAGMAIILLLIGYLVGYYFLDNPIIGLILALVVWGIMSLIAFYQGDSLLLGLSGARKIKRDDNPRLYNIVEEMKIASGLPKMPNIYIIDDPALNAFATGRDPSKASVAVTSGLLAKLNRDELQGVIGHEMAHIKNRDVLLMAMCAVMLGTIVILAWYATRVLFFSGAGRRSSGGGGGGLIILAVGIGLLILAPILAQIIYFTVSRKREYLADASSALYTRYPEGLASALEKISASPVQLKSANKATAPMYTINPFREKGKAAANLTSTHPPIQERIRILRAMSGAALADYDQAYRQAKGQKRGIAPASALALDKMSGVVGLREASPEAKAEEKAPQKVERARQTSDMMWRINKYRTINCSCGTKLRVSPEFKGVNVKCPHCGRILPVQ
ncbi:MAG: M48 family metallopeptidase [Dehalococcoidia bacterium]